MSLDLASSLHGALLATDDSQLKQILKKHGGDTLLNSLTPSPDARMPLLIAARSGGVRRMALLLKYGARLTVKDADGMTVLHHAACSPDPCLVHYLLGNEESWEMTRSPDSHGNFILHLCARYQPRFFKDSLASLLKHGVEVNTTNAHGETALHIAAQYNNPEMVTQLIAAAAPKYAETTSGETALMVATRVGAIESVRAILSRGVDPYLAATNGKSAYDICKNEEITHLFNSLKASPLHSAVVSGDVSEVKKVLSQDSIALNHPDHRGRMPLHTALRMANVKIVKLLVQSGADPTLIEPKTRRTALLSAASSACPATMHTLLSLPVVLADPPESDEQGNSVLHVFASFFHSDPKAALKAFVESGVDINAKNNAGHTALQLAAQSGSVSICTALLQMKADPHVLSSSGENVLHFVARTHSPRKIRSLVSLFKGKGVDPNVRGVAGLPLDVATPENIEVFKFELAKKPVTLNVYDLVLNKTSFTTINNKTSALGFGVYHTGLEYRDKEISFSRSSGIYFLDPRSQSEAIYRKSIILGYSVVSDFELGTIIDELRSSFVTESYSITKHNCNDFTNALALKLCSRGIPPEYNRLAKALTFASGTRTADGECDVTQEESAILLNYEQAYSNSTLRTSFSESEEFGGRKGETRSGATQKLTSGKCETTTEWDAILNDINTASGVSPLLKTTVRSTSPTSTTSTSTISSSQLLETAGDWEAMLSDVSEVHSPLIAMKRKKIPASALHTAPAATCASTSVPTPTPAFPSTSKVTFDDPFADSISFSGGSSSDRPLLKFKTSPVSASTCDASPSTSSRTCLPEADSTVDFLTNPSAGQQSPMLKFKANPGRRVSDSAQDHPEEDSFNPFGSPAAAVSSLLPSSTSLPSSTDTVSERDSFCSPPAAVQGAASLDATDFLDSLVDPSQETLTFLKMKTAPTTKRRFSRNHSFKAMERLFNRADKDSSGYLDAREVRGLLRRIFRKQNMTTTHAMIKTHAKQLMRDFEDNSGHVDFDAFHSMYSAIMEDVNTPSHMIEAALLTEAEEGLANVESEKDTELSLVTRENVSCEKAGKVKEKGKEGKRRTRTRSGSTDSENDSEVSGRQCRKSSDAVKMRRASNSSSDASIPPSFSENKKQKELEMLDKRARENDRVDAAEVDVSLLRRTQSLNSIFRKADKDNNGGLDRHEIRSLLRRIFRQSRASLRDSDALQSSPSHTTCSSSAVTSAFIRKYASTLMKEHDQDNSGLIEFEEFMGMYSDILADDLLPDEIYREAQITEELGLALDDEDDIH